MKNENRKNITIISYSNTGNNKKIAEKLAAHLSAKHIIVNEKKKRSMSTIVLDIMFNRTPQINPIEQEIPQQDLIIFIAPIWMGQVASPLRSVFSNLNNKIENYIFISISGGANGPNPQIEEELPRRLGKKPLLILNPFIADILPHDPKPEIQDTMKYSLTSEDVDKIVKQIIQAIEEKI